MAYPYTIQDLLYGIGSTSGDASTYNGGVWEKLSQREDMNPQWVADAVIEISRNYPFQELQRTSATVQMAANQYGYPYSEWIAAPPLVANLIPSFYMFYNDPSQNTGGYNPGVGLTFKTIDSLELMFSTPGTPAFWSRWGNQIYIAPQPNQNYWSYMRYQQQHAFSNPAALTDVIHLPDDWREVIEYSAAVRGAGNFRMLDYAASYKATLFGDPKKPGDVGLIQARVTSMEADIVSNQGTRQIRPMGRW